MCVWNENEIPSWLGNGLAGLLCHWFVVWLVVRSSFFRRFVLSALSDLAYVVNGSHRSGLCLEVDEEGAAGRKQGEVCGNGGNDE